MVKLTTKFSPVGGPHSVGAVLLARPVNRFFLLVFGGNILFLLCYPFFVAIGRPDLAAGFIPSGDHTTAEILGYAQFLTGAVLLVLAGFLAQNRMLYFWAALAVWLCLDDMFLVHEKLRDPLTNLFFSAMPANVGRSLAEITWALLTGALFLIIYGFSARHTVREKRHQTWWMLIPFGFFVAFAVGVDIAHQTIKYLFPDSSSLLFLAGFLEDGGEMVSTGLIAVFAIAFFQQARMHA